MNQLVRLSYKHHIINNQSYYKLYKCCNNSIRYIEHHQITSFSTTNTTTNPDTTPIKSTTTNTNNNTTNTSTNTSNTNNANNDVFSIHNGINLVLYATFGYLLSQAYFYITDWPEPCSILLQLAQHDNNVISIFGDNIRVNGLYTGNVYDCKSTISIPIHGSKQSGILHGKLYRNTIEEPWLIVYAQYSINNKSQRYTISTDAYNQHVKQQQQQQLQQQRNSKVTDINIDQLPDNVKLQMQQQINKYHRHMANKQSNSNKSNV